MKKIHFFRISAILLLFFLILIAFTGSMAAVDKQVKENVSFPQDIAKYSRDLLEPVEPPEQNAFEAPDREETYPDYVEIKDEDRKEEIQALLSTYSQDIAGIDAASAYTVTLGAWRNLRPTESYLWDVSLLPDDYNVDCSSPEQKSKGWIVGDAGTILSYCNGVWDQSINVESLPTRLWGVQAISPTLGVAVGEQGAILMYLWDRIARDWVWTKHPIPVGNQTLYHVAMVPDGTGSYTGWAVGAADATGHASLVSGTVTPIVIDGQITHFPEWNNVTDSFPNLPEVSYYYGLQLLSPTNGWVTGGIPGVKGVIIHWDGTKWSLFQEIGNQAIHALHMRSATDGWAGGFTGELYHYDGSTWKQLPSPTKNELVDIDFDENGIGWAVGEGGTLLIYKNGQWSVFNDLRTDPFDFRALDFTSGHGWLVGLHKAMTIGGHILEYEKGLWLAVTPPTDNQLNDISTVSDNDAWAVGSADNSGGTIIHWDGKHWQRWYQDDLPIPAVDLFAVEMTSSIDGWAAGDPQVAGEPAVVLHWDGHRWAPPRADSPVNVRIQDISMLSKDFGWAVASTGNAVAKYDGLFGYWSANHTCQGVYYDLRGVSIVPDADSPFGWDAWAVGTSQNPATGEYFLRYEDGCSTGYAWDTFQSPSACPPPPNPDDGPTATNLRAIHMSPEGWGFAAGNYRSQASAYYFDGVSRWNTAWCHYPNEFVTPSRIYSIDIVDDSGVAWFAGFYSSQVYQRKVAFIQYHDTTGFQWAGTPFPLNGVNIYDRPIRSIRMSSDTMGWAVGDPEDTIKRSVIYQYPYPNFTLNSTPERQAIMPGETAEYMIDSNSIGGFSADVSLSLLDLPADLTGEVTPGTINVETQATVSIHTTAATPLGVYEIPLLGYSIFHSGDVDIPVWRVTILTLTLTDHPVYEVSPAMGPAGTVVMISGANFGPDPGAGNRSTEANHVSWAGVQMPDGSVTVWSNTQIKFIPPDNPDLFLPQKFPLRGDVSVTASGTTSNADFYYQIQPNIDALSIQPESDRILVTLNGTSFGKDPGSLFRSTWYEHINLGGVWIPNTDVVNWSNDQINFYVDSGTVSDQVVVTSNGYESNTIPYIAPGDDSNSVYVYLPMLRK